MKCFANIVKVIDSNKQFVEIFLSSDSGDKYCLFFIPVFNFHRLTMNFPHNQPFRHPSEHAAIMRMVPVIAHQVIHNHAVFRPDFRYALD